MDAVSWWALLGLCAFWIALAAVVRALFRAQLLRLLAPTSMRRWPRVSVVIPACNEAETLVPAVRTLLSCGYPDLEIVVVDDRSTDGTSGLVDMLAREDRRVRAVHVRELPPGWLGKVHALHLGARNSSGEWLLFTDADVHFSCDALTRAISVATERKVDHLAVYPEMRRLTLFSETLANALGLTFLVLTGSSGATGVGAFNLVRRELWKRSEGFPYIRMEVADDMGVGIVVRRAGGRALTLSGAGLVGVQWYASFEEMARGMEKNMFAISARYSVARWAALVTGLWMVMLSPIAAMFTSSSLLQLAGGVSVLASVLVCLQGWRTLGGRVLAWLLAPMGPLLMGYLLLRSGIMCLVRGGVLWRGTLYPLAALRAAQRVKL